MADELGYGIKKIANYTKIYSGGVPKFKDNEIFKVSVPFIKNKVTGQVERNVEEYKYY